MNGTPDRGPGERVRRTVQYSTVLYCAGGRRHRAGRTRLEAVGGTGAPEPGTCAWPLPVGWPPPLGTGPGGAGAGGRDRMGGETREGRPSGSTHRAADVRRGHRQQRVPATRTRVGRAGGLGGRGRVRGAATDSIDSTVSIYLSHSACLHGHDHLAAAAEARRSHAWRGAARAWTSEAWGERRCVINVNVWSCLRRYESVTNTTPRASPWRRCLRIGRRAVWEN